VKIIFKISIILFITTNCSSAEDFSTTPRTNLYEKNQKSTKLQYIKKTFTKSTPQRKSLKQRILILDSEVSPIFKSSFYRHKNKILSYYTITEKGYQEFYPQINAPKMLDDLFNNPRILEKINNNTLNKTTAIKLLELHHKIKIIKPQYKDISHGEDVFLILAQLNPKSQFVFTPFPEIGTQKFCSPLKHTDYILKKYKRAAQQIKSIIQRYKINYVNISYATTIDTLKTHNKNLCNENLNTKELNFILKTKKKFIDELSKQNLNTTFFISLPNNTSTTSPCQHPGFAFSCAPRDNFIRVSYRENYPIKIGKLGLYLPEREPINDSQKHFRDCTDIRINGNVSATKSKQKNGFYLPIEGFYPDYIDAMSTSYATPLALSFYLHLNQATNFKLNPLIFKTFAAGKIFDPITYKNFNYKG
jgi:hypothetical protein